PGDRRVHGVHPGAGAGLGPGRDDGVPRRGGHPAGPQGRSAAARRRGGGRGRPRPAGGAGPAVRPAAAVPRVQAHRGDLQRPTRRRGPAPPPHRRPGTAPRRAAAGRGHQHRGGGLREAGGEGDAAQAEAPGVRRPHPRAAGQRAGAGRDRGGAAEGARGGQLPRARRGHRRHPHRGGPVPGPAGAVPGEGRRPGPGERAGRADGALDRGRRGRRPGRHRRGRPAARAGHGGPEGGEQGMSDDGTTARHGVAARAPSGAGLDLEPAPAAALMAGDERATVDELAKIPQRPARRIADALAELADEYTAQGRGFELRLVAGGWRFYSRPEYAAAVEGFVLDGQQARLTQAALETLAVVAYRQPVSRSRVSAVRGVNCDGVMRTLLQRGLIEEAGTEPETGAILYTTTNYFLERMGLRGLDELPELAPFLPEAEAI